MTYIKSGDAAAAKLFNVFALTEVAKQTSILNILTGVQKAPRQLDRSRIDGSTQTSSGYPVIHIDDMGKRAGDEVSGELFHRLRGLPTMGDRKLQGRAESLTLSSFSMRIDQTRHLVESGGRMTRSRLDQDLQKIAVQFLAPWAVDWKDQVALIHMAGARGDEVGKDWTAPLASHPDFNTYLVNDVMPPTFDRHLYGGDATSLDTLDSADKFTVSTIERLRLYLDEMANPLQSVKLDGDMSLEDMHVLLVTPRQWHDLTQTAEYKAINSLRAQAAERGREMSDKRGLFAGECLLWRNILVKKMTRAISFKAGSNVSVSLNDDNATVGTRTVGVDVHRAILLGAQALASAYGNNAASGKGGDKALPFSVHTEITDHGNNSEHSLGMINGMKKLRFRDSNGRMNDHGIICVDTAVSVG